MDINRAARAPRSRTLRFLPSGGVDRLVVGGRPFHHPSIVGVLLLRRFGRADLDRLRTAFTRDGVRALHLETPGVATMVSGILLIFPGFITDLLGAALLLPAVH